MEPFQKITELLMRIKIGENLLKRPCSGATNIEFYQADIFLLKKEQGLVEYLAEFSHEEIDKIHEQIKERRGMEIPAEYLKRQT
ncbi:MAG TPA: hypothetical protein DIT25_00695 [Candidatus Moranbacteria bacterium]|nr:hypothetical protein [Candidatus Moranbacteria bacterium]